MGIISEKDRAQLEEMFREVLQEPVNMVLFKGLDCEMCEDVEALLGEVAELSDKINLEVHDIGTEPELAKTMGVEQVPGLVITKENNKPGILFTGAPFGYEFTSVIEAIRMLSVGDTGLPEDVREKLRAIDEPVRIKVFVTPSCPYCPRAVITAHKFAMENDKILGEMIEAQEFPEMSQLYNVYAVPKVVINEKVEFEGALPEKQFLDYLLAATETEKA